MNREGELGYRFVVVSAARHNDWPGTAMGVHETYIFGATPEGEVLNWGDLAGSVTGHTNHALALSDIGYTVVEGPGI